eukprot:scaffold10560_cov133-Isochrysis_galbana.AAC.10
MADEQPHRERGEGGAHHGEVGGRPHDLPDHLRMASDPDDACLPQMEARLLHRGHLLQIEDGGVQEEEGRKVDHPEGKGRGMREAVARLRIAAKRMGGWGLLCVPRLRAQSGAPDPGSVPAHPVLPRDAPAASPQVTGCPASRGRCGFM